MLEPATATWRGTVGKGFKADEFDDYVASLGPAPRWVKDIALHNTGAPTLQGWKTQPKAADQDARVKQRLKNIAHGYRTKKRPWNAGPHLFVDDEKIWVFTPLDQFGIHSPSWNKTHWGIEAVGDWSKEDPPQALVDNLAAALAVLCEWAGLDPNVLDLHFEDPATDHDCPGVRLRAREAEIVLKARKAMETLGGEHSPHEEIETEAPAQVHVVQRGDTLFGIARRYGLKVGDLVAANGSTIIVPGQIIDLTPDVQEDFSPPPPEPVEVDIDRTVSDEMLAWTALKEGLSLVPYQDVGGIWHIGFGDKDPTLNADSPPITKAEALRRKKADIKEFEGYVNRLVTVPLTQSQFDALTGGLVYNIGPTLFAKSSVLRALNAGDYKGAREAFLNFHRAGGKAGVLTKRREAEQRVWDGDYGDVSRIPVYYEAKNGKLGKPKMEPFPTEEYYDA